MAVIFVAGGTGYLGRQLIPRLLERLPSAQQTARRLGLVTLAQMTAALVCAVEQPATDFVWWRFRRYAGLIIELGGASGAPPKTPLASRE